MMKDHLKPLYQGDGGKTINMPKAKAETKIQANYGQVYRTILGSFAAPGEIFNRGAAWRATIWKYNEDGQPQGPVWVSASWGHPDRALEDMERAAHWWDVTDLRPWTGNLLDHPEQLEEPV
jgi:hypothetical protein